MDKGRHERLRMIYSFPTAITHTNQEREEAMRRYWGQPKDSLNAVFAHVRKLLEDDE